MTSLPLAERLVALLVAHPAGAADRVVRATLGGAAGEAAATLRARGYDLRQAGSHWRLGCAARHFDPAAFEAARSGRWGSPCEVWEVAGSTNDLARQGALGGAPEGALWLAETQTAGRGRQGRTWNCGAHAGILASWILRGMGPSGPPAGLLPLAVGLGLCEGLRAVTQLALRTKWPNDIYLEDAKVAGILVEARPGRAGFAVVGLGLNVEREPERDVAAGRPTGAVGTRDGRAGRREALLAAALAEAERRVEEWRSGRHASLLAAYRESDLTQGRAVRVACGKRMLAGRGVGIGASGCLLLEGPDGRIRELAAGEVHLS